jgi:hypothetical protein
MAAATIVSKTQSISCGFGSAPESGKGFALDVGVIRVRGRMIWRRGWEEFTPSEFARSERVEGNPRMRALRLAALAQGNLAGGEIGGAGGIRTHEWRFCRPLPWATWVPRRSR